MVSSCWCSCRSRGWEASTRSPRSTSRRDVKRALVTFAAARAAKAVLAIALMGAFDELVQSFLPYRSGDMRDWLIDITAAFLASGVLAVCTLKAAPARLP